MCIGAAVRHCAGVVASGAFAAKRGSLKHYVLI
jgi:hypothetical protein